jgi:hypothetical protein
MNRLSKLRAISRIEKLFLCEASVLLLLSVAFLKMVPFKCLDRFLRNRWLNSIKCVGNQEPQIKLVQRSVSRASKNLPCKSLCLSRAIAEFIMLRRRGIPAVLFAGARFSGPSSLDAHAWIKTYLNNTSAENLDFVALIKIGNEAFDH